MNDFSPPLPELPCIRYVDSFEELVSARFSGPVNALCWPRKLEGDFAEIVEKLRVGRGITTIDEETLAALELSPAGEVARKSLLEDQAMMEACGLLPVLDCINGYVNLHEDDGPVSTHVQSYHVDSATDEADTYLCTYFGASSEALPNDQVIPKAEIPALRAELLALHGGEDDEGFAEFLNENFYDLHYAPLPGAEPWSFGVGNLWRIACEYPGSPVPPCVHRAPDTIPGAPPRLLLIG
ncbi:hypothetical protein OVA24_19015 [Luteolibacter sp. SL250]|uniref:hypothetical protein n=1 Tax=Luteolibacter sp. SL250 TaxID=2995170 RepID=UPI002270FF3D|nr:hypothetical protein [Luteolibacter sp. SL250]WAC19321.1 hypothetical protein OVA24_19015 [Luteolibacter sp. SL250]